MDPVQFGGLLLYVERRVKFLSAHDDVSWKKRAEALDMVRHGEAVIIQTAPLILREARFFEFRDEERRRHGRVIPGVEHPDPDRLLPVLAKDGKRHPDHAHAVFEHHEEEGSTQGVCFPPPLIPEEIDFQRYRRRYLRHLSEEQYARQLAQEQMAEKYNERHGIKV
jgi:hypothetical protein